jgi:hypothetical protein
LSTTNAFVVNSINIRLRCGANISETDPIQRINSLQLKHRSQQPTKQTTPTRTPNYSGEHGIDVARGSEIFVQAVEQLRIAGVSAQHRVQLVEFNRAALRHRRRFRRR